MSKRDAPRKKRRKKAAPTPPDNLPAPIDAPLASSESGVGPVDALARYTAELRNYPPISREEERELAIRVVEQHDQDAFRRLVLSNLRLVVKIAMEYRRAWTNALDLIQEGNVGLLQAVQRFDPYQDVKLSTYAVYWIRAYILKYIIDNIRMVKLGTTRAQRKLFFRLNKEKRALESQGFRAEPKLIAERLDVSEDDVIEMDQRLSESDLSMEAPARRNEEGGAAFGDFVPAGGESSEEQVSDAQLREVFVEHVKRFAEKLDERERQIVQQRILADEPRTLREIGEDLGVTRERVRQLEARIVAGLRDYLRENMVDFEYYAPGKE